MSENAPAQAVYVRMYRGLDPAKPYKGWLGDCFLIRLVGADGAQSHILIDCGILLGSPDAAARMQVVADDIVATTGGHLDLLVVTHEHWDHISGFSQAASTFVGTQAGGWQDGRLKIGTLWMAWTENPTDPQAQGLRARFDKGAAGFAALADHLDKNAAALGLKAGDALQGLDGFLGLRSAGGALKGREIMEALKAASSPAYLEPGTVLPTPAAAGAPALRAYVLGPPRCEKRLFKDSPSGGEARETYLDDATFGAAMQQWVDGGDGASQSPFAAHYCANRAALVSDADQRAAAPAGPWLAERYYGGHHASPARKAALDRRRIDGDWLAAAGPLALKLDSDTNNTSLVLAFDLPDGTAMLFAADAQVGNWESWHDQPYTHDGTSQSAEQILNRVRFYKVGHHGSHNATMRQHGLEMMTRPDLVAAIPTDEELGKQQGSKGWQMPYPDLFAALTAQTKGRVLRNDRRYSGPQRDPALAQVEADFFDRLKETDLYLEYRVL